MPLQTIQQAPRLYARIAGLIYLLIIVIGIFGEIIVRARLIVPADHIATAHNILAHQFLFRSGIAGDLIMHLLDLPTGLIVYVLLRPVNKDLSLLSLLFGMLQTAMLGINKLTLIAALTFVNGADTLPSLNPKTLPDLTAMALNLHEQGFGIGLLFFGVSCLITGYLILRADFLPNFIGYGQILAGLCYLINSFALILSPALADKLVPAILLPAFLGELATALWFTVKGVDQPKWLAAYKALQPTQ